jgi:hypothetical protein
LGVGRADAVRPYNWWREPATHQQAFALPAQNPKNSVKMVGHDNKGIQCKFLPDLGGFEPLFPRKLAAIIFIHAVFDHTAEDAPSVERAERDKVRPR